MSNLLGPRDANGIPVPMTVDESIASMKASLLKKIKRSAYVYRVDCGGCNGCEIEIFATLSPLFDAERFGFHCVVAHSWCVLSTHLSGCNKVFARSSIRKVTASGSEKYWILKRGHILQLNGYIYLT